MNKLKTINIDILRLLAAIMVVAIHTYPLMSINNDLDYLVTRIAFRIAVPFFFMLTGYFLLPKAFANKINLKKYIIKILKLYILATIIYLPLNIYIGYFQNNNILSIIKDLLINGTFYHLWYFPALLTGILIIYFSHQKIGKRLTLPIVFILYFLGLFGDSYFKITQTIPLLRKFYNLIFYIFDYTRNGIFYAPIFIYFGFLLHAKKQPISFKKNLVLIFINYLFLLIEGMILYYLKIPKHTSMYIFLLPVSFYIFNLIVNTKLTENKNIRKLSNYLYILHPLFITIVHWVLKYIPLTIINNSVVNYILVLILTITTIEIILKRKKIYSAIYHKKK